MIALSRHSDWPHAPAHRMTDAGAYIVTAGTLNKICYFKAPALLDLVLDYLFSISAEFGWALQAWAVLANHYHFVALTSAEPDSLSRLLAKLHGVVSREVNRVHGTPGRQVWFQYWDSHITYERSYLARLNYVHYNPVRHGIVKRATDYPWCSAAWFERTAKPSFVRVVRGFKTDRVRVVDDF
jgi:putative transposase